MGCRVKGRDEACQVLRSEDEQLNTAIFELRGVTNESWDGPLDGMYTYHKSYSLGYKLQSLF